MTSSQQRTELDRTTFCPLQHRQSRHLPLSPSLRRAYGSRVGRISLYAFCAGFWLFLAGSRLPVSVSVARVVLP